MKWLILILTLSCASAQDIFVPLFESSGSLGNNLLTGLEAFYTFTETSGGANDSSVNARHLTEHGSISAGTGIVDGARLYSPTASTNDQYFFRSSDSVFAFTGDFTVAGWMQVDQTVPNINDRTMISRGGGAADLSWAFMFDNAGSSDNFRFYWSTNGTLGPFAEFQLGTDASIDYYFIYARRQSGVLYISATYLTDPALEPEQAIVAPGTLSNTNSPQMWVGDWAIDTIHAMSGQIDELGIWTRSLSYCELSWLFSARSNVFTYPAFTSTACAGFTGYAQVYDNFDAYADATNLGDQTGWSAVQGVQSISGGKVYSNSSSAMTGTRKTTPTFAADQSAWVTLTNVTGGGTSNQGTIGAAVRMQSGSQAWYGLFFDNVTDTLYLYEEIGGTFTGINSTAKTYANGNRLRISVTGTGAAIRLSADEDVGAGWVNVWTNQTTTSTLNSGQPGVSGYNALGAADLAITDFFATDL